MYETVPAILQLDVTQDVVMQVAARMQGAAGPSGVNFIAWQGWLLHFGEASHKLRESVAALACWLANT
eukprot:5833228-Ditylum_brightwellii.AAC.1